MVKLSKEFAADMQWLIAEDKWGEVEKEEARRCLRGDPVFFTHFLSTLVAAKRKGYACIKATGYQKLAAFCAENGLPDPYNCQFTDAQVDGRQHDRRNGYGAATHARARSPQVGRYEQDGAGLCDSP